MATPNFAVINTVTGGGPKLPVHDYAVLAYVGSTNNVATITGYRGGSSGTVVGTLTFTYVASGSADDDDVATITLSTPTTNG